jgi:hypothetical protein
MVPIVGPILEESRKKAAAKVLEVGLVDGLKHLGENDGPDITEFMKKALGENAARKISVMGEGLQKATNKVTSVAANSVDKVNQISVQAAGSLAQGTADLTETAVMGSLKVIVLTRSLALYIPLS